MRNYLMAGVIFSLAVLAYGQERAVVGPEAAGQGLNSAGMQAIIEQLGDKDFAVRQKAQAGLEGLPLSQRDELAKLIEKTTDEEVKARLTEHLGKMDERIAIDPPGISVELVDAPMEEVAKALSKATGTTILPSSTWSASKYTLKATNQPFWEVMRQLEHQQPVWINGDPPVLSQTSFKYQQIIEGVAVSADDAKMSAEGKFWITINTALDPRIRVIDLHAMQVEDARDDRGHLMRLDVDVPMAAGAAIGGRVGALRRVVQNGPSARLFQSKEFKFSAEDGVGKSVTIKGAVKFLVATAETTTEVANAGKHLNEGISIGDSSVTLFEPLVGEADPAGHKRIGLQLQIMPNDSTAQPAPLPNVKITATGISMGGFGSTAGTQMIVDNEGTSGGIFMGTAMAGGGPTTHVTVTDADGKVVANYTVPRGLPVTSVHVLPAEVKGPLTFKFAYASR
ncbi:MAG TPA: hypothetical protein VGN88_09125, partial [Phycisphaerae bacterium]